MAVCHQDHGGVAVPIAGPLAGGFLQPLDLLFGQIFPGAELRIGGLCGELSGLRWLRGVRLRADFAMGFNPGLASTVCKVDNIRTVIKAESQRFFGFSPNHRAVITAAAEFRLGTSVCDLSTV